LAEALLEAVRARGIRVREVRPGDRLVSLEGETAVVLWPLAGGVRAGARQEEGRSPSSLENDRSLVLRLVSGPASFLLPGDLEETGERALLAFLEDAGGRALGLSAPPGRGGAAAPGSGAGALDVLVLKVGHHGSADATSEEFLTAVTPAFAVVSTGPNPFGHPAPGTLSRLKEAGTVVFVTREDGAVTFNVRGKMVRVRAFLSRRCFEWSLAPEGAARAGAEGLVGLVSP
jgi:competence protein ComEC